MISGLMATCSKRRPLPISQPAWRAACRPHFPQPPRPKRHFVVEKSACLRFASDWPGDLPRDCKNPPFKRPLYTAISTRNEGRACLGGRICAVMKSLQNLSNNQIYQKIQMVNAPAGGQAGAARCGHRAKCCDVAVGLCRGLLNVCASGLEDRAACIDRGVAQFFLNTDQLVVFGKPVRPRQ